MAEAAPLPWRRVPEAARRLEDDFSVAVPFGFDVGALRPDIRIAALCHIFYLELTLEFQRYLANIPVAFDT